MRRRTWLAALTCAAAVLAAAVGAQKTPTFSFGVIADIQYRDADNQGTRFYRDSLGKLRRAVEHLNALAPRFTIQLGDLIDGEYRSYDAVLPILGALAMPRYHVLGNHDFSVEPAEKALVLARLGLDAAGSRRGYYDFAYAGWRFVVLNGNDVSVTAYPPGSTPRLAAERYVAELKQRGARNAHDWNGAVGPMQREWLARTLAGASKAGERVIVFSHFPVLPAAQSGLWNDQEVLAILRRHACVAAYFAGHAHEGGYVRDGPVHYLTFRGMVEGEQPAYALVEVGPDALRITGFGRETSRVLRLGPAR